MRRPFLDLRIFGPIVSASPDSGIANDRAEDILQKYVDFLSDEYSVDPPEVRVWNSDVWVQIVIDPDNVKANYDSFREQINLRADDIRFEYTVHEFAHHLSHRSDNIDLVLSELVESGIKDPDVLEGMNEMQVEKLADEIAEERKVRLNWNQVVANSISVPKVDL